MLETDNNTGEINVNTGDRQINTGDRDSNTGERNIRYMYKALEGQETKQKLVKWEVNIH